MKKTLVMIIVILLLSLLVWLSTETPSEITTEEVKPINKVSDIVEPATKNVDNISTAAGTNNSQHSRSRENHRKKMRPKTTKVKPAIEKSSVDANRSNENSDPTRFQTSVALNTPEEIGAFLAENRITDPDNWKSYEMFGDADAIEHQLSGKYFGIASFESENAKEEISLKISGKLTPQGFNGSYKVNFFPKGKSSFGFSRGTQSLESEIRLHSEGEHPSIIIANSTSVLQLFISVKNPNRLLGSFYESGSRERYATVELNRRDSNSN